MMARPLWQIAADIQADWARVAPAALPYLMAMRQCDSVTDRIGFDTAERIVRRFLAHSRLWRGETARRIKQELQEMLK